jgi:hypothetical protein
LLEQPLISAAKNSGNEIRHLGFLRKMVPAPSDQLQRRTKTGILRTEREIARAFSGCLARALPNKPASLAPRANMMSFREISTS